MNSQDEQAKRRSSFIVISKSGLFFYQVKVDVKWSKYCIFKCTSSVISSLAFIGQNNLASK